MVTCPCPTVGALIASHSPVDSRRLSRATDESESEETERELCAQLVPSRYGDVHTRQGAHSMINQGVLQPGIRRETLDPHR